MKVKRRSGSDGCKRYSSEGRNWPRSEDLGGKALSYHSPVSPVPVSDIEKQKQKQAVTEE